jgi:hypothetical protein
MSSDQDTSRAAHMTESRRAWDPAAASRAVREGPPRALDGRTAPGRRDGGGASAYDTRPTAEWIRISGGSVRERPEPRVWLKKEMSARVRCFFSSRVVPDL